MFDEDPRAVECRDCYEYENHRVELCETIERLEKKIEIYEKALSEIGEDTYEPNSWTIYKSVIAKVAIKALEEGNEL